MGPKHPGFDHDAQLALLTAAAASAGGSVRTTDCLALCSASNVVVVRTGGERIFLGRTANLATSEAVAAWIAAGAPSGDASVGSWVIDPQYEFEEGD